MITLQGSSQPAWLYSSVHLLHGIDESLQISLQSWLCLPQSAHTHSVSFHFKAICTGVEVVAAPAVLHVSLLAMLSVAQGDGR